MDINICIIETPVIMTLKVDRSKDVGGLNESKRGIMGGYIGG